MLAETQKLPPLRCPLTCRESDVTVYSGPPPQLEPIILGVQMGSLNKGIQNPVNGRMLYDQHTCTPVLYHAPPWPLLVFIETCLQCVEICAWVQNCNIEKFIFQKSLSSISNSTEKSEPVLNCQRCWDLTEISPGWPWMPTESSYPTSNPVTLILIRPNYFSPEPDQ